MGYCHRCGSERDPSPKIGFKEVCGSCNAYLHCCKNCRFFDPPASRQCREPQAELVSDKEKGNHCEYFELSSRPYKGSDGLKKREAAKTQFDSLFKK
jgi:hypothetical protein